MEQQNDEAICYASVCARLETATPGASEGSVVHVNAAHQDVAAVSSGLQISIIDVRVCALRAPFVEILHACDLADLCRH